MWDPGLSNRISVYFGDSGCPCKLHLASSRELERNDPFGQERHLRHYCEIELDTPHIGVTCVWGGGDKKQGVLKHISPP